MKRKKKMSTILRLESKHFPERNVNSALYKSEIRRNIHNRLIVTIIKISTQVSSFACSIS